MSKFFCVAVLCFSSALGQFAQSKTGFRFPQDPGTRHGVLDFGSGLVNFVPRQVNRASNDFFTFGNRWRTTERPTTTEEPTTTTTTTEKQEFVDERGQSWSFKTDESCVAIDGGLGSCISIKSCQPYLLLLQTASKDPNTVNVLRRSHCGFEGNDPKVCCPTSHPTTTSPPLPPEPQTPEPATPEPPPVEPVSESGAVSQYVDALPDPPVCGFSNASFSRVVGGVPAKLGDFPWMALLGYHSQRNPGEARWLCGGTLVTEKHVLSAAHCLHGRESDLYVVRLGELDLSRTDEGATPIDVPIKQQIKHESYSAKSFTNDIAILLLSRNVEFTSLIRPICLPRSSELRALTFERYTPLIAGWGDTEFRGPSAPHLQVLQLPVVTNEFCANAFKAYKAQVIDQRVLCAGFEKGGKDACQGDSGGPLMQPIYNPQTYKTFFYQIGVVSFGRKCAQAGFPGVYSRTTHFMPWLYQQLVGTDLP